MVRIEDKSEPSDSDQRQGSPVPVVLHVYYFSALFGHLGLNDVGVIERGKTADLVAFDADTIADDLEYRDPVRKPKGIAWVIQAGLTIVEGDRALGGRHGHRFKPQNQQ